MENTRKRFKFQLNIGFIVFCDYFCVFDDYGCCQSDEGYGFCVSCGRGTDC